MAAGLVQAAASAAALLSHPAFQRLPPRPPLDVGCSTTPAPFAATIEPLDIVLEGLGCSPSAAHALDAAYRAGCHELALRCSASYSRGLAGLQGALSAGEDAKGAQWQRSFLQAVGRQYRHTADAMRDGLFDEVRSAQARHAASPPAHEPQEPGQFTPDVLAILHAAFNAADHVSKAERRTLAAATALSERQILTWVRPSSSFLLIDEYNRTGS